MIGGSCSYLWFEPDLGDIDFLQCREENNISRDNTTLARRIPTVGDIDFVLVLDEGSFGGKTLGKF